MQERLFETRLTKYQRRTAAKCLKEYFTLPSIIAQKTMTAEVAATKMTPGYVPSEVQSNQSPSSKVERYTMVMDEVNYLKARYGVLCRIHDELIDDRLREFWELAYNPRYYHTQRFIKDEMMLGSNAQFYGIKNKLLAIIDEHFGDGY